MIRLLAIVFLALSAGGSGASPQPAATSAIADLVVRTERLAGGAVRYGYVLRNPSIEYLHNFMVGTALSDSCPELRELPLGWSQRMKCPRSIAVARPWHGCVGFQEECNGHFLEFDYPEGYDGIPPGDSLRFSVTVPKADSTHEHVVFWIVGEHSGQYVGRAHREGPVGAHGG
jgi:hypothetical protein